MSGLARAPLNLFRGSLIPHSPFGGGWSALNLQAGGEELSSKIWNNITDFQIWSTLFTEFTHMIKSLYRKDAARQVEAAQRYIQDYGELNLGNSQIRY